MQTWYRPPGSRPLNTVQEKRRLAGRYPLVDVHLTKGSGKRLWTVKLIELRVWEDLLGTSGSKGQGRGHSGRCYLDEGCVQEETVGELRRSEGFSSFHIYFPEVHGRPWAPDSAVCQRLRFSLAPLALVHCSSRKHRLVRSAREATWSSAPMTSGQPTPLSAVRTPLLPGNRELSLAWSLGNPAPILKQKGQPGLGLSGVVTQAYFDILHNSEIIYKVSI